ncbi:glycosyltransferase family 2 protein [Candidatus Sumerlaeota bacterium]
MSTASPISSSRSPRVSVLLPVHNGARFVAEAIESILVQTFEDFELIIIDDASTDETPAILARLASRDARARVITNETNLRQAGSLNRGLGLARSAYVAIHDADDRSFPTRLAKQVAFLDDHPEYDLVGTHSYVIDEDGSPAAPRVLVTDPARLEAELLNKRNWVTHGSVMLRAASELVYRDKFLTSMDYEALLRMMSAGRKLTNLPDCLYQYRFSRSQITSERKLEQSFFAKRALHFHQQRAATGRDDYEQWDHLAELADYQRALGHRPALLDAEFNYRRGLLYQLFTNGVYGPALKHAAFLLAHYAPWRLGLRWSALLPLVILKSSLMLLLGRSRPAGFDWPEPKVDDNQPASGSGAQPPSEM